MAAATTTPSINNMFNGTRNVIDLTGYMLMRGVTDFGDLRQFNLYESGYSFFVVMGIPKFLYQLCNTSTGAAEYVTIIKNYAHILEYEHRGLSGIEAITTDVGQLTNGLNQINIINKVNKPSDTTFSASYQEKLGSTITKAQELFLTGIKDPRTQVKTYHGLIDDDSNPTLKPGYENEIFKFMYIVCDNTLRQLERAVYLASCQPTSAPLDIYTSDKGTYEFKEISVEFNGFPIMSREVNDIANAFRSTIFNNTVWMESDKNYNIAGNSNSSVDVDINSASISSGFFNDKNIKAEAEYGKTVTVPKKKKK